MTHVEYVCRVALLIVAAHLVLHALWPRRFDAPFWKQQTAFASVYLPLVLLAAFAWVFR